MAAPASWYTVTGGNVDVWWRGEAPATVLGARFVRIHPDEDSISTPARFAWPGRFSWLQLKDGLSVYPHHEGAAVWTRPCLHRAAHAIAMQQHGVRTLAEVDDNYLSEAHLNLFMRANGASADGRLAHLRALSLFDGVIFSTDWLRDRYRKELRKIGSLPELHVARNHVPDDQWPEPTPYDGPLRVGWMGSAQHARDIKLAGQALATARNLGCEAVLMGHDVRDETGVKTERGLANTRKWAEIITRHVPWVDPEDYHRQALPFDIGLAPLELNDHTLGKSDIKAIEYAVSGAVPVVSAHPVYTKHWKHNETCLVASSPAEFDVCVRELIRSRSLRGRLVGAAQAYVREERGSAAIRKEWMDAIS